MKIIHKNLFLIPILLIVLLLASCDTSKDTSSNLEGSDSVESEKQLNTHTVGSLSYIIGSNYEVRSYYSSDSLNSTEATTVMVCKGIKNEDSGGTESAMKEKVSNLVADTDLEIVRNDNIKIDDVNCKSIEYIDNYDDAGQWWCSILIPNTSSKNIDTVSIYSCDLNNKSVEEAKEIKSRILKSLRVGGPKSEQTIFTETNISFSTDGLQEFNKRHINLDDEPKGIEIIDIRSFAAHDYPDYGEDSEQVSENFFNEYLENADADEERALLNYGEDAVGDIIIKWVHLALLEYTYPIEEFTLSLPDKQRNEVIKCTILMSETDKLWNYESDIKPFVESFSFAE